MKHFKKIILAFTLCSTVSSAIIINVPADIDSIQGGIDMAVNGDTVLVQPGTYVENINFKGKNIVVGSLTLTTGDTSYISQTVIDGDSSGSVVRFENGEDSTTVFYGFTATNGRNDTGGGIYIQDSSPRLSHLIVKNNTARLTITFWDAYGGGIYCEGSNSILSSVTVRDNKAVLGQGNAGGGIYFRDSSPTLVDVEVKDNTVEGSGIGGGICCEDSDPFFSNTTVVGNSAEFGGGIGFGGNSNPIFDPVNRSNIYFNEAHVGRDLLISDSIYVAIFVDTFTVAQPDDYFAYPENNFTFDILNAKVEQVNSDLYINPDGDNNNSGLSPLEPLKTIGFALMRIMADSLEPHNIYLANGRYSPSISGEIYPLNMRNYVSLHGESELGVILDADNPNATTIIFFHDRTITLEYLTITGGLDGIYCFNSSPNIKNVTVTNNGGDGIFTFTWYSNAEPFLYNVTVSKNNGYGIHCHFSAPNIVNAIIWNNTSGSGLGDTYAFYSDIQGGWSGIGNINADPMFVDTANGNYRLQAGSPCIDAGIQDTIIIYNNGQDTLIVPPIPYLGSAPDMGAYEFDPTVTIQTQSEEESPKVFSLQQNYPNPFNPTTNIEFSIPKSEFVTLKVYNILGEEVATLVSQRLTAGKYKYDWDASSLASGVYLYRIQAGTFQQIKKMVLIK